MAEQGGAPGHREGQGEEGGGRAPERRGEVAEEADDRDVEGGGRIEPWRRLTSAPDRRHRGRTLMRYWPNPAHKRETTEAGPPAWHPSKDACPPMTIEERRELLQDSISLDPEDPRARRYAMRWTDDLRLELYEAKWTREVEGEQEFHGHPTRRIPASVLRRFRDQGRLTEAEYKRLIKELGA